MEVPLKFKINGYPEKVWGKWYEFFDVHTSDMQCPDYQSGLSEEVNTYYTAYDLPTCGARVAAMPMETESEDAFITVQGLDENGLDVFTTSKGYRIHGERLKISKEDPVYSRTTFTKITGIEKSQTCNYVRLYWQIIDEVLNEVSSRGLLAEYGPTETHPSYRRFRVAGARCDCCVKVTILGRVKDLDYKHDNDILPISSLGALRRSAQLINAEKNDKLDVAQYHQTAVDKSVEDENAYYRTGAEPFDFLFDTSPGATENLQ